MICPKCKSETSSDSEFCIVCGAELSNNSDENTDTEERKKDFLFLFAMLVFMILLIISIVVSKNNTSSSKGMYKSLTPLQNTIFESKNPSELIVLLIQQEKDLSKATKKFKQNKMDKIFGTFYENLIKFSDTVPLTSLDKKKISDGSIVDPKTELFKIQIGDYEGIWINNKYLFEKYSSFLSPTWQEYLKILSSDVLYDIESGNEIRIDEVVSEIVSLQKFLQKYPNFVLKEEVKKVIHTEVSFLLLNESSLDNNNVMTKENIEGYEKILKLMDTSAGEYKVISECYKKLQLNNFSPSVDFYKTVHKYSKDEWHKELYENAQKTIENQQPGLEQQNSQNQEPNSQVAQINFDNFTFTKEEFSNTYRKSADFCSQHLSDTNEDGSLLYSYDGSFDSCIKKMFEQKNPEYLEVYNAIWNHCSMTRGQTEGETGIKQCLIEGLEKIR